jgi:hypothetical protein
VNEANLIYREKNANPAFRGTVSGGYRILRGLGLDGTGERLYIGDGTVGREKG